MLPPKFMSVSSSIRFWLLVVACVLSLGTLDVDAGAGIDRSPDRCDGTATASSDGCTTHPGPAPARGDAILAEPDLRTLKGASPRSDAPLFAALLGHAQRFSAPQMAPLARAVHSRTELRRTPALFVLRC